MVRPITLNKVAKDFIERKAVGICGAASVFSAKSGMAERRMLFSHGPRRLASKWAPSSVRRGSQDHHPGIAAL